MIRKVFEILTAQKSKDVILESKPIDQSIIQDQNIMFLSRRIRIFYIIEEYNKKK